jgi:hypothetical protein
MVIVLAAPVIGGPGVLAQRNLGQIPPTLERCSARRGYRGVFEWCGRAVRMARAWPGSRIHLAWKDELDVRTCRCLYHRGNYLCS